MPAAFAWDSAGHQRIAYMAYLRMHPVTRERLAAQFAPTASSSPSSLSVPVTHWPVWVEQAPEPDRWKHESLGERFERVSAAWPLAWPVAWKRMYTDTWHYRNVPFWDPCQQYAPACRMQIQAAWRKLEAENSVQWNWQRVLPLLHAQLADPRMREPSATARLIVLWFVHLVADAHQPLHTVSRVHAPACHLDRGGNDWCLSEDCRCNLHRYWDHTGSKRPNAIRRNAARLLRQYADSGSPCHADGSSLRPVKLDSVVMQQWTEEHQALQVQLYREATESKQWPSAAYARWKRETSERLQVLAACRLAYWLDIIYAKS